MEDGRRKASSSAWTLLALLLRKLIKDLPFYRRLLMEQNNDL